jgi:hypothetical protein
MSSGSSDERLLCLLGDELDQADAQARIAERPTSSDPAPTESDTPVVLGRRPTSTSPRLPIAQRPRLPLASGEWVGAGRVRDEPEPIA